MYTCTLNYSVQHTRHYRETKKHVHVHTVYMYMYMYIRYIYCTGQCRSTCEGKGNIHVVCVRKSRTDIHVL